MVLSIRLRAVFVAMIAAVTGVTFPLSAAGEEWVHMKRQTPDQTVSAVLDIPDGLWAAAGSEYYRYDGISWRLLEGVRDQFLFPYPFLSDEEGKIYILDQAKLGVLDGGVVRWYDSAGAQAPVAGTLGNDGMLYVTSNNLSGKGIYAFDGDSVVKIDDSRGLSLAVDREGSLWATVRETGGDAVKLICREDSVWTDRTAEVSSLLPPLVYANNAGATVKAAPDGAIWVNNRGKYAVLRDGVWSSGGGGGTPVFIDFDATGGVWGYNATSLYLLDQSGLWRESRPVTLGPPLGPNFMAEAPEGGIWFTDSGKLYRYRDGKWSTEETPYDLASDQVTTLAYAYDGTLFCGHGIRFVYDNVYRGISIWDGERWFNTRQLGTATVNNVYHLETTPSGSVMAYTDMGFFEYDNQVWAAVDSLSPIVDASLTATDMAWENLDTIWLSTYSGLARYNDQKYPSLVVYLPPDPQGKPKPMPLYSITVGGDGLIYCQDESRNIISFEESNKIWEQVITDNFNTHDFELDINDVIWGALEDGLAFWNESAYDWELVVPLTGARKLDIDSEGRIWVSGVGGTGYYSNEAWRGFHELDGVRAADFAFSEQGDVAITARDYANGDAFKGVYILSSSTGIESPQPLPVAIQAVNVPNPFNPSTSIRFNLPEAGQVRISVYSANGQLVRSFGSNWYPAGWNSVVWDAVADDGGQCASGVYFYHIVAGKANAAGKMLFMR